jgi:hypothetical protein
MEYLNWELSVLSRAVAYSNLSGAAANVGVSQPQLSRIVARLEGELGVTLLDRAARRKSSWTTAAYRLAEVYGEAARQFRAGIETLAGGQRLTHVQVGVLEGLIPIAARFARHALGTPDVRLVELKVEDLNDLEELFFKRSLDFLFTVREPGRKKHGYVRQLGFQTLDPVEKGSSAVRVESSFEHATASPRKGSAAERVLVSNSLQVRKHWIEKYGGRGILPSEVRSTELKGAGKGKEVPVLLVGAETLSAETWKTLSGFRI